MIGKTHQFKSFNSLQLFHGYTGNRQIIVPR